MQITSMVQLGDGETFPHTAEAAAQLILDALGGDSNKDHSSVSVSMMPSTGEAGKASNYLLPAPEVPPEAVSG